VAPLKLKLRLKRKLKVKQKVKLKLKLKLKVEQKVKLGEQGSPNQDCRLERFATRAGVSACWGDPVPRVTERGPFTNMKYNPKSKALLRNY